MRNLGEDEPDKFRDMRKRMGGGQRRSTNEWCGRRDDRSRSNRNVGTPGEGEREDSSPKRGRTSEMEMCAFCFVFATLRSALEASHVEEKSKRDQLFMMSEGKGAP
jgi:hypothetical protein